MKRKYRYVCIIYMIGLVFFPLYGQDNQPSGEDAGMTKAAPVTEIKPIKIEVADEPAVMLGGFKITLGEAIKKAVESNYDILSGAYDVAMSDTVYEMIKERYPWVLGAGVDAGYDKYPKSMSITAGNDKTYYDVSASILKTFSSGTSIVGGFSHSYSKVNREPIPFLGDAFGPPESYSPSFYMGVSQELLKNAFGINDRKVEKIAKNTSQMQREAYLLLLSLATVEVISRYWNVVNNSVTIKNLELQLIETKKVRGIIARNAQVGLNDTSLLNFYNAQVAGVEAGLSTAKLTYRNALRDFLTVINMNENSVVEGTAYFSNKMPNINVEESLKTAYQKRADYISASLALENAKINLKIASNDLLPSLKASFNAAFISQQSKASSAYNDMGKMKYPVLSGALMMTYPIDSQVLNINERNARFQLKKAELQFDKTKRTVKDNIYSFYDIIKTSNFVYEKAKEARIQSELAYNAMLADLKKGRITSATVKQSLDGLIASRQGELASLILFNNSLLLFEVAKNELFEKYNINVNQYIPKK